MRNIFMFWDMLAMKVCVGIPYKCKLNGRYPFHIYLLELLLIMETIDWHWSVIVIALPCISDTALDK